jgi:hypothetical protein
MPIFKLPTLPSGFRLVSEKTGAATNSFQIWWQQFARRIEDSINGIEAALVAAGIALDAAAAANAAAANAQSVADSTSSETSLVNSYPSGFTPPLVSADALGNVTIANHQRVYGDSTLNPTVSVTGATIPTTGVAGDAVRVYYSDPSRAGGAVTYLYTVDPAAPPVQGGNTHSVGAVTIPGAGTNPGNPVQPPGYANPIP